MKKSLILAISVLFLMGSYLYADSSIKKILSIGANEPNYLFMTITGVIIDENKNIYVSDSGGPFLRKYSSKGEFIKEIGRLGEGPGEFSNSIGPLFYDGQSLYLLDNLNHRIVVIDKELEIKNYINIKGLKTSLAKLDDFYYLKSTRPGEPFQEIGIYDQSGKQISAFFNERPAFLREKLFNRQDYPVWMMYSGLAMDVDSESKEVAVTFNYPDEKIELYFFNKDGSLKRKHMIDNIFKYKFPEFLLKMAANYPQESKIVYIKSIHYLTNEKILLQYWVADYKFEKCQSEKHYLLLIDKVNGKLIQKFEINPSFEILSIRNKILCGREIEDDMPKVALYKIEGY